MGNIILSVLIFIWILLVFPLALSEEKEKRFQTAFYLIWVSICSFGVGYFFFLM